VGPPAHFADHAGRLAFRHGPGHAAVEFRDRRALLEGFLLRGIQVSESVHGLTVNGQGPIL
jgi:hypothetical protein